MRCGYEPDWGGVRPSDRPDLSHFQCNGALAAAGRLEVSPRKIAQLVTKELLRQSAFENVSIAGPGFINLTLTDEYLTRHVQAMAVDSRCGVSTAPEPLRIVVDYGGANVAKPMHVGHLRSAIIGESLKRIAKFLGHYVFGDVHLGDWGLQMGLLISEFKRRQPDLPYFDVDYSGDYPTEQPVDLDDLEQMYLAVSAAAQQDPIAMDDARRATFELQQGRPGYRALWQHFRDISVAELRKDYAQLNVEFDLWLGESDTQTRVPSMIERLHRQGVAIESQGALVIETAAPEEARGTAPLMLVKSDGAILYGTTDLATIEQRVQELDAGLILYVVDTRQADHFEQVFQAARLSGIAPADVRLEHVGFGTMNGKDGKPFKTRTGGVLRLRELMRLVTDKATERMSEVEVATDCDDDERREIAGLVGLATLKYADLMNHRAKDYVFDLDRFSSFEGRTGPYLLYTTVRTRSIIRKASARGVTAGAFKSPASDVERSVLLKIAELPEAIHQAWGSRAPNHLCDFGYGLAAAFNRFYHEHHILTETDREQQASWLALSEYCVRVLSLTLELLGLEAPKRM